MLENVLSCRLLADNQDHRVVSFLKCVWFPGFKPKLECKVKILEQ